MKYHKSFDRHLTILIDSIKALLYHRQSDVFERIDFDNDSIYLEPLLYTYLNQANDKWMSGLLYGYSNDKSIKADVCSNRAGIIYIPQVGYFKTSLPNTWFSIGQANHQYQLDVEGTPVDYSFEPLCILDFGIELQKHQHPLIEDFLLSTHSPVMNFAPENFCEAHIPYLNNALQLLAVSNPKHFALLVKTLKRIALFTETALNSFAALEIHNMIFLNANSWDMEMFYVDHLSHEGAHITFNTLTYESKFSLFKQHYNTAFSQITGDSADHGSLYLSFHGLFTFVEILESLKSCMLNEALSPEVIHEAKGRFAFQLQRFKNSLNTFLELDIVEGEGQQWLDFFLRKYRIIDNEYGHLPKEYTLLMPSYDFNAPAFERNNPLPV